MRSRKIFNVAIVSLFLLVGCSSGGSGSNSDAGGTSSVPGDTSGGNTGNDGDTGGDTGSGGDTGGGDPVITGQITDGIWTGTYTINGTDYEFDVVIYDNQLFGFTSSVGYEGTLILDNNAVSGALNEYINTGELTGTASISATVIENTSISGSIGDAGATFDLAMDSLHNRSASSAKIAGNWSITIGSYVLTFSILDTGTFDGSDTSGCVFNGNISVPDPSRNIYQIAYSVSSCGSYTGDYSGLALLDDFDTGTDNALVFTSVTTGYLNIGYLLRQ